MTHSRHTTVMYRSLVLLVVLSGVSLGQKEPNDYHVNSTCPTWTVYDSSTSSCECGIHWIVFCKLVDGCPKHFEISVVHGFCMTLNEDQTKTVAGSCFSIQDSYQQPRTTHVVPNDTSQLDTDVCGYTHRTGQLCGQCVNGTSPLVYS